MLESGCWQWVASKNEDGYGIFRGAGYNLAHQWSFRHAGKMVPPGMEIDHVCRNRACVNPDHLEAVPHVVNCRRGGNAQATHCKNGHEFTPENTIAGKNRRTCRECRDAIERARRATPARAAYMARKREEYRSKRETQKSPP